MKTPMFSRHAQLMNLIPAALVAALVAGCQSSPSLVKADAVKPVTPMELKAGADGVEMAVTGLIFFNSPGSWKKRAYWDEYIVRLENHRPEAVMIETIVLGDVLDRTVAPGVDPWAMEYNGIMYENYLYYNLLAPAVAGKWAQLRPPATSGNSKPPVDSTDTARLAGNVIGVATGTLLAAPGIGAYGAAVVIVAATPVVLVDQVFIAPKNRQLVLNEFNRRRLVLPVRLEPGTSVTGSVFFPLTPGPEKLSVRGKAGEGAFGVTLELPGLEGLHFTYVPDKAALKAATSWKWTRESGPQKLIPERIAQPALPADPH